MAKELTPQQKKIRQLAKRLAQDAGKDWKALSKEDRRSFLEQARGGGGKKAANPVRERAKKAAQDAGLNWKELSADQRKAYIRDARKKAE